MAQQGSADGDLSYGRGKGAPRAELSSGRRPWRGKGGPGSELSCGRRPWRGKGGPDGELSCWRRPWCGKGGPTASSAATARHGAAARLEGMDPNSSYVLKIRLLGNPKKSRKDIKCFYLEKVIDSDLTNYKDLVESITVQYQPRYVEVAHLHYYDEVLKTFPEIKSDQELMYMFEKHKPPKKRTKTTKTTELSIAPCEDGSPTRMCFTPSKSLETTTKKEEKHVKSIAGASNSLENTNKKGKGGKSKSVRSKRSRTTSNKPEPISIEFPMANDEANVPVKVGGKSKKKECAEKIPMVPQDSPAMCTRSKNFNPASPSMSTRSKRRLSL